MLEEVPETFAWLLDPSYDDQPYAAMADLASFLYRDLLAGTATDVQLNSVVSLWQRMAKSDDPDVHSLLVSGVLGLLTDSRTVVDRLLPRTTGRLRNLYEYTILTSYGREKPDWFHIDIDQAPDREAVADALKRIPE